MLHYEVEVAKAEIQHNEPFIVDFSILQNAKLRMLELYYNFFTKFFDVNKLEQMARDTEYLYLAHAEKQLEDSIRPEMKQSGSANSFTADAVAKVLLLKML